MRMRAFVPLTQCAWCNRIGIFGQHMKLPWMGMVTGTLTISVPAVTKLGISFSHGICPNCAGEMQKQLQQVRNL